MGVRTLFARCVVTFFSLSLSFFSMAAHKDHVDQSKTWQGWMVSGNLGAAWNHAIWNYESPNYFNTLGATVLGDGFDLRGAGFAGGASAGYLGEHCQFVWGFLMDMLGMDLNKTIENPVFAGDYFTTRVHFLVDAKTRLGYALGRWLLFFEGGYSGAPVKQRMDDISTTVKADATHWSNGWLAGFGVAYRASGHLSVGLSWDYRKLYLNNARIHCPNCGVGVGQGTPVMKARIPVQTVLFDLSYYF